MRQGPHRGQGPLYDAELRNQSKNLKPEKITEEVFFVDSDMDTGPERHPVPL